MYSGISTDHHTCVVGFVIQTDIIQLNAWDEWNKYWNGEANILSILHHEARTLNKIDSDGNPLGVLRNFALLGANNDDPYKRTVQLDVWRAAVFRVLESRERN